MSLLIAVINYTYLFCAQRLSNSKSLVRIRVFPVISPFSLPHDQQVGREEIQESLSMPLNTWELLCKGEPSVYNTKYYLMILFQQQSSNGQLLKGQNDSLYFTTMGNPSGNNLTWMPLHTRMQVPYCITNLSPTLCFPRQSFWLINCVFFKTVACIILCGDRGKEEDSRELFPECLCI